MERNGNRTWNNWPRRPELPAVPRNAAHRGQLVRLPAPYTRSDFMADRFLGHANRARSVCSASLSEILATNSGVSRVLQNLSVLATPSGAVYLSLSR